MVIGPEPTLRPLCFGATPRLFTILVAVAVLALVATIALAIRSRVRTNQRPPPVTIPIGPGGDFWFDVVGEASHQGTLRRGGGPPGQATRPAALEVRIVRPAGAPNAQARACTSATASISSSYAACSSRPVRALLGERPQLLFAHGGRRLRVVGRTRVRAWPGPPWWPSSWRCLSLTCRRSPTPTEPLSPQGLRTRRPGVSLAAAQPALRVRIPYGIYWATRRRPRSGRDGQHRP
jgi:hypothetical protein